MSHHQCFVSSMCNQYLYYLCDFFFFRVKTFKRDLDDFFYLDALTMLIQQLTFFNSHGKLLLSPPWKTKDVYRISHTQKTQIHYIGFKKEIIHNAKFD